MKKICCHDGTSIVWGMTIGSIFGLIFADQLNGLLLGAALGLMYELTRTPRMSDDAADNAADE